jgi:hypothetical protein
VCATDDHPLAGHRVQLDIAAPARGIMARRACDNHQADEER